VIIYDSYPSTDIAYALTIDIAVNVDMANNIESTSRDTFPPTSTMAEKEKHEDSPQPPNDSLDLNVPDDPDMPLNWPKSKRWINIMIVSILTLLTYVP
jgi:hypothetical protein